MKKAIAALIIAVVLTGCAKRSANIQPLNVSPSTYSGNSCIALDEELEKATEKLAALSKKQDDTATGDAVIMTVGALVFWPALLFMFSPDDEYEVSRLKGECNAIKTSMRMNNCVE